MKFNIEYALYDMDFDEEEVKNNLILIKDYDLKSISIPYYYTKLCRSILKDSKILTANAIDYPFGISDTKTRNSAIINSISNGSQKIEIVIQNNLLSNRKYDKIRQDIKTNKQICDDSGVELCYYLEYRIFTHHSLIKACDILKEYGFEHVYPSTGYMIDNIDDNIIASILLRQKSNINTIFTGNIWNKTHIDKLIKNNIFSIRANKISSIKDIYENIAKIDHN